LRWLSESRIVIEDGVTGDGVIERYDPADALGMIRLDRGGTLRIDAIGATGG